MRSINRKQREGENTLNKTLKCLSQNPNWKSLAQYNQPWLLQLLWSRSLTLFQLKDWIWRVCDLTVGAVRTKVNPNGEGLVRILDGGQCEVGEGGLGEMGHHSLCRETGCQRNSLASYTSITAKKLPRFCFLEWRFDLIDGGNGGWEREGGWGGSLTVDHERG